jgi:hypothetical protein
VFIGISFEGILSCSNNRQGTTGADGVDSLFITYRALSDSVDYNWAIMIADDDDKHVLMKRLLLEVSYTNNYDKARFNELTKKVDELKVLRYDQNSMRNSALIDMYDSATFDLSDQIIKFARSHPRYDDFPMMEELIDDINAKNNFILLHRIHYDNWVKKLNSFKQSNQEGLQASDPGIELETMPLFELPS